MAKEATHEQFLFKKPIHDSTLHLVLLLRTPLTHHQNGSSRNWSYNKFEAQE